MVTGYKASGPAFDETRYLCWSKKLAREGISCTKIARTGVPQRIRLFADPLNFQLEMRAGSSNHVRVSADEISDIFRGLASPDFAKFSQKYNQVVISTDLAKRALVFKASARTFSYLFEGETERDLIAQFVTEMIRLKANNGESDGHPPSETTLDNPPKQGFARVVYPDYSIYEGDYDNGQRHGSGTLTLIDGTRFIGLWAKDERHGQGTEYWVDGTVIQSNYARGQREGSVEISWPHGSIYKGDFENGRAHGEGELWRRDGTNYRGQFQDDCIHGEGTMEWRGGIRYVGQFVQNRREGLGSIEWPTGHWSKYSGDWKDSKHHGRGTLVDRNGNCFSGSFFRGKLERWDEDEDAANPPAKR